MIKLIKFIFKLLLLAGLTAFKHGELGILSEFKWLSSSVTRFVLNFAIFWLSLNIIIRMIQLIYRKRKKYGDKFSDNVIVGLQNIYYLFGFAGLIIMILGLLGIEPKELITGLSIIAASIAIITKELAMDIICGIQISFSKDLAIGDYVKIGEQKGRVIDINITKIILQNVNDDIIYIPNSKAYFSELINYTQKEIRKYNVDFSIHPNHTIPLETLHQIFKEVLKEYIEFLDSNEQSLRIEGISNDEIRYKIQYKLNQVNPKVAEEIKSKLMNALINKIHHVQNSL